MSSNSPWTTVILIGLMVAAFYLLLLRPQKKRQQAQQRTMDQLVPGMRVLLGSGLFGTVTSAGIKQATLEVAPGVEVTVLKQAIARVLTDDDEFSEPDLDDDESFEPEVTTTDATEPGTTPGGATASRSADEPYPGTGDASPTTKD